MNFTLHLTADCNLACRYCYEKHTSARMDERTALAACDLLFSFGHKTNGFSLFGGEPLLCRGVIESVLRRCAERNAEIGGKFSYRMTTNGLLLDESFLKLAAAHDIDIALSHDGLMHDAQRVTKAGGGTAQLLEPKIDLLLSYQPNAIAMLTVLPENAAMIADSVIWLYNRGFSKVNVAIDCRPDNGWDDASMETVGHEYARLAEFCAEHFDDERPLHCLNLESKVAAYLEDKPCHECHLGFKQPSIAPDGVIYPCNQFLNRPEYRMGDVWRGIDRAAQMRFYRESLKEESSCAGCAIEKRCRHHCACLNYSMTGDMHEVPAVQCANEQALIMAADRMAEKLYKKRSPRFMRAYGKEGK